MSLQGAYEFRSLSRHYDEMDREHAFEAAIDHIVEEGIECPRCEVLIRPYARYRDAFKNTTYRARMGWREDWSRGTIEWRCPYCEDLVKVNLLERR